MTIEFLGAAKTVTGSMHLITTDKGNRILLDCGLYQGRRLEAYRTNKNLPFDPSGLDAVILSHAHIDHSGNLPSLMNGRNGKKYRGFIHCTPATYDLCSIMLPDSAHIQESDAQHLRKNNMDVEEPIYDLEDVNGVMERMVTSPYMRAFQITDDVKCTFYDAGHILGSALSVLDIKERGETVRLCFTGDVGRPGRPILRDPQPVGDVDILLSESTYGGRKHNTFPDLKKELKEVIDQTIKRGGKVIIPSFAVGRTQDIVYILNVLFEEGELPRIPIYVDSPLAVNATDIFRSHLECFNERVTKLLETDPDPFGFQTLQYIRHVEDSKKLNQRTDPCVIISASGMMEAGRILHHLLHSIEDERNTVLIVGFQAEHTLGRRIVERNEHVRIFGGNYALRAQVKTINGLSAHADHDELLGYIGTMSRERMRDIYLVHGEEKAAEALRTGLLGAGFSSVHIPAKGDQFYS